MENDAGLLYGIRIHPLVQVEADVRASPKARSVSPRGTQLKIPRTPGFPSSAVKGSKTLWNLPRRSSAQNAHPVALAAYLFLSTEYHPPLRPASRDSWVQAAHQQLRAATHRDQSPQVEVRRYRSIPQP